MLPVEKGLELQNSTGQCGELEQGHDQEEEKAGRGKNRSN